MHTHTHISKYLGKGEVNLRAFKNGKPQDLESQKVAEMTECQKKVFSTLHKLLNPVLFKSFITFYSVTTGQSQR